MEVCWLGGHRGGPTALPELTPFRLIWVASKYRTEMYWEADDDAVSVRELENIRNVEISRRLPDGRTSFARRVQA